MFIGHYGAALAGKKIAPRVSLGTLVIAGNWLDLLAYPLILLGVERVKIVPGITKMAPLDLEYYPFSHGLLAVVIWSMLLAGLYYVFKRYVRGAVVIGLCIFSHWFLDFLTHRPDLPLGFGKDSMKFGLGLWNSVPGTVAVEISIFILGIFLYLKSKNFKLKHWGRFGSLILILSIIYIGNIFGPPPPSGVAMAASGMAQWIFVAWAYWIEV